MKIFNWSKIYVVRTLKKKMVRDLQFYSNMLLQSETAGTVYKKYGT